MVYFKIHLFICKQMEKEQNSETSTNKCVYGRTGTPAPAYEPPWPGLAETGPQAGHASHTTAVQNSLFRTLCCWCWWGEPRAWGSVRWAEAV